MSLEWTIIATSPSTSNATVILTQEDFVDVTVATDPRLTASPNCSLTGGKAQCHVDALPVGSTLRVLTLLFDGDKPPNKNSIDLTVTRREFAQEALVAKQ